MKFSGSMLALSFVVLISANTRSYSAANGCDAAGTDADIAQHTKAIETGKLSTRQRARAYFDRGNEWKAKGNHYCAIADYDKAIAINPTFVDAFVSRAHMWWRQGNSRRALADLDEAVRLHSNHAPSFYHRGYIKERIGQLDAAISDLSEAIRIRPKYSDAYFTRGLAWERKRDYANAIKDFDEYVRLEPDAPEGHAARGDVLDSNGAYNEAIAAYDTAIDLDASFWDAYKSRGIARTNLGNYAEAIADFDIYIKQNPEDAGCYESRARARFLNGEFSHAVADAARAFQLKPSAHGAIWLFLARSRSGVNSVTELAKNGKIFDATRWPAPVVAALTGKITPETLMRSAAHPDPQTDRDQVCEANYYLGQWYLIKGDREKALPLFREAQQNCPVDFLERAAASTEIKRLPAE
jgi:tetratricopeptide (TPR) repeat protein